MSFKRKGVLWVIFLSVIAADSCSDSGEIVENAALFPAKIDDKSGYIDAEGDIIIPARFEEAYGFSEGLAAVKVNGKIGYIDLNGKLVIRPQFDDVPGVLGDFSDGMAQVRKDGKYGYVDMRGNLLVKPQWDEPKIGMLEKTKVESGKAMSL